MMFQEWAVIFNDIVETGPRVLVDPKYHGCGLKLECRYSVNMNCQIFLFRFDQDTGVQIMSSKTVKLNYDDCFLPCRVHAACGEN